MKDKRILRYVGPFIAAVAIFVACMFSNGGLFGENKAETVLYGLCNCFTIPGILLSGVGGISWAGKFGTFDMLSHGSRSFLGNFIKPLAEDLPRTFYDYKKQKDENTDDVLKGVSFTVKKGKTIALVGASGGGKTTICHLLPRFYVCEEGKITIGGVNINDVSSSTLRDQMAVVSQDVFLFAGSVRENIMYGSPTKSEEEMILAAKRANIHDFVMSLPNGYDTEVGERGVKLSGGQKQRISIARAFLKNPSILILDEATSALDNMTEMQVQAALSELSVGRTTLVVAHRLSTVKNADEILVVDDGRIEERGTHEQLVALGGTYAELYRYQFKE